MEDYYKILGIHRNASDEDIKKAYRKLAHKYHPDKSEGDEVKFKKINEAYQILSNKDRKAQYDKFGKVFEGGFSGKDGSSSGWDFRNFSDGFEFGFDGSNFQDMGNIGDVFDAFFEGLGVKKKRKAYHYGADLEITQEITLEEAYRGSTRPINYKSFAACKECSGLGYFEKEGVLTCEACDGRGEIQESRQTFFGNFAQVKQCKKCFATGKIPKKPCKNCSGAGRIKTNKTIELNIASGVQDGQIIKIAGAGEVGERGAEAGDLYVKIRIKPHPLFRREGDDLLIQKKANLFDLLIDKSIMVETISGEKTKVEIPAGYRFGEMIIMPGFGMPRLGGYGKGNLIIIMEVEIPKKVSAQAKALLEDLKKELS